MEASIVALATVPKRHNQESFPSKTTTITA